MVVGVEGHGIAVPKAVFMASCRCLRACESKSSEGQGVIA